MNEFDEGRIAAYRDIETECEEHIHTLQWQASEVAAVCGKKSLLTQFLAQQILTVSKYSVLCAKRIDEVKESADD